MKSGQINTEYIPSLSGDLVRKDYVDSIETGLQTQIDSNDTDIISLSSGIDSNTSNISINTSNISDVTTTLASNSGDWDSTFSTVGSNSATWGSGGGVADYDISYLTADYTVTSSWGNVGNGMSVTAPSAGTYMVIATVPFKITGPSTGNYVAGALRFHNGTSVKGSSVCKVQTQLNLTTNIIYFSTTIVDIFTCTNAETINLQAEALIQSSGGVLIDNGVYTVGQIQMVKL